ncbi:MAG: lysylphosphatidylglycerol synthase domain-containing protein [Actinomycetes bacterium]
MTRRPGTGSRWFVAVRWVVVVAAVAFAVWSLVSAWAEVRAELRLLTPLAIVVAVAAFVVGTAVLALSWYLLLGAVGRPAECGLATGAEVFGVGQLGKYAPGAVWPVVVQTQLGQRHGLRWRTILVTYTLSVVVVLGTGAVVALGSLAGPGPHWLRWVVVAGAALGSVLLVAVVHPDLAHQLLGRVLRRLSGEGLPARLAPRPAAWSLAAGLVWWLVVGVHAAAVLHPLGVPSSEYVYVTGCFALAWVAGVAAVPVPAGVGVREAVLVLTLGSSVGRPTAVTLALVSRLVQVVVDLGVAGLLAALGVFRRAGGPGVPPSEGLGLEGSGRGK